ncbi:FERM and PDZ domain-containing protein 2 [Trichinella sp. T9]|nr:FERM and PDZ domain-containing protein 2 [Trichinella sp. T9]
MTAGTGLRFSLTKLVHLKREELNEAQLWSLVLQSIKAIEMQSSVSEGKFEAFSFDDLHITEDGCIVFCRSSARHPDSVCYIPPECEKSCRSEADFMLSKMYLYSLGCLLADILAQNPNIHFDSSPILHSVVNMMKLPKCESRIELPSCKQIVENQVQLLCLKPQAVLESLFHTLLQQASTNNSLPDSTLESGEQLICAAEEEVVKSDCNLYTDGLCKVDEEDDGYVPESTVGYFTAESEVGEQQQSDSTYHLDVDFERGFESWHCESVLRGCTCCATVANVEQYPTVDNQTEKKKRYVSEIDELPVKFPDNENLFAYYSSERVAKEDEKASNELLSCRHSASYSEKHRPIGSTGKSFSAPSLLDDEYYWDGEISDDSSELCWPLVQSTLEDANFDQQGDKSYSTHCDSDSVVEKKRLYSVMEEEEEEPLAPTTTGEKKALVACPQSVASVKTSTNDPFVRGSFRSIRSAKDTTWQTPPTYKTKKAEHYQAMRLTLTLLVGTNSMHARLNWPRAEKKPQQQQQQQQQRISNNRSLLASEKSRQPMMVSTEERSTTLASSASNQSTAITTVLQFDDHGRMPSIRLKAPCSEQKKLFFKVRDTNVLVILLNGRRVDVTCKTNCTALDIFEVVSRHTNLSERHFFGLTYLKDGEHYFLEPEEKIYHFAPPGWRVQANQKARVVFTLYLRLKFYPVMLDFVKTQPTMHHIYLQLRHDVVEERLKCDSESAYQLGGVALQAEIGNRPADGQHKYFDPKHYLPSNLLNNADLNSIAMKLADVHVKYSNLDPCTAEMEYLKQCQTLREYGIHFYRLYRTKPSQMLTVSPLGDPDTGIPLWIGIMSRGLVIFEEQGGVRVPVSHHPWHLTQTLQFDRKKFHIVTRKANDADSLEKSTFFTDSYRKSSYFVNFAASQHRFCIKMRSWASTLLTSCDSESNDAGNTSSTSHTRTNECSASLRKSVSDGDSGISRETPPNAALLAGTAYNERAVDVGMSSSTLPRPSAPRRKSKAQKEAVDKLDKNNISIVQDDGDCNASLGSPTVVANGAISSSDLKEFDVDKNVSFVDSEYDLIETTLVKHPRYGLGLTLVDGEIQGLKGIYIRSMTVGGPAELDDRLKIGDKVVSINGHSLEGRSRLDAVNLVRDTDEARVELRVQTGFGQRLDTADGRRHWSDEHTLTESALNGHVDLTAIESNFPPAQVRSGLYSSLYSDTDSDTDENNSRDSSSSKHELSQCRRESADVHSSYDCQTATVLDIDDGKKEKTANFGDIDWTDSIAYDSKWNDDETDLVEVVLEKNQNGTLGIQVAGGKGQKRVYIKRIVDEPALSCPNIRPGDRLAMVNGKSTEGLSHADAVALLREAQSPVILRLWRSRGNGSSFNETTTTTVDPNTDPKVEKLTNVVELEVVLKKTEMQLFGLSLGKPLRGSGIYIRAIAPASVAANDGRLQVGDRIWKIDGDLITDTNPADVVQRLKLAVGNIRLTVRRDETAEVESVICLLELAKRSKKATWLKEKHGARCQYSRQLFYSKDER